MSAITTIAIAACIGVLGLGALTLFTESGYRFDLRRARLRRKLTRAGGRRIEDGLVRVKL